MVLPVLTLSHLFLAGCAVEGDAGPVFGRGDAAELELAEELAYEQLFTVDGAAAQKGVQQLRTLSVEVDVVAMAHTKVQALHQGVPVWGSEAVLHLDSEGEVAGLTDDLVANVSVNTTPDYDAADAIELAVEAYGAGWDSATDDPTADLWVIRQDGVDHLAWRVTFHELDARGIEGLPVRFIDAHSGELVWGYNNLQTATCTGTTNYYGTVSVECYTTAGVYYLEDTTELLGTFTWNNTSTSLYYASSASTVFGTDEVSVNAVEAHYASDAVNDYYSASHARNGIDGAGGPAYITTHGFSYITSTTSYGTNYVNASWDPTNQYMTYGDGDGVTANSLTTLDIAGHEFTHGVTQYEANLTYSGESGGLNESMSDVFGAMVERSVLGASSNTWLVGEQAWTPGTAGDALRYMNDPQDDGVSYGYYFSGIGSAGVHYSSGVGNLAFYLLSEGGTHPRGTSTTVVTGIGADDAAAIWYLALSSYMTSSTNYSGARTATLSAAAALFGSSSTQYTQVGNAWTAVGVLGASTTCTTSSYSGSLARSGKSAYAPSSSGTSVTIADQTVSLTGPSSGNFDAYLQKKSGRSWSTVASGTGSSSTESFSYSGTSGTYRVLVYSASGGGTYNLSWCR